MDDLHGMGALVTGAAGGLGGYIAQALAAEGVRLIVSDLPGAALEKVTLDLKQRGADAQPMPADLCHADEVEELAERATKSLGGVDILVNNAGVEFVGSFHRLTPAQINASSAVNLVAPMLLTHHLLPGMLERGRGHIVNIASIAGRIPLAYFHTYNATKAGLIALTHALRGEYGDRPVGFSVICPGFITDAGMYGRVQAHVPVPRRLGTLPPERVGEAVVKAVKDNVPETVLNRRSVKAVIMLGSVYPRAALRLAARMGAKKATRRYAEMYDRL